MSRDYLNVSNFYLRDHCNSAHAWRDGSCIRCGEREHSVRSEARKSYRIPTNAVLVATLLSGSDVYRCTIDTARKAVVMMGSVPLATGRWQFGELTLDRDAFGQEPMPPSLRQALEKKIVEQLDKKVFGR